jgi:hypothetical protein
MNMLRHIALFALTLVVTITATDPAARAAEPFWRQVIARKRVEADPNADYTLTEKNGPWLIMAASFSGEQGEQEARQLVGQLRQKYNLPAFYYAMTFQIEDQRPGKGLDNYGAPIRRRYQRGSQALEHAVLVGEFPQIDDPDAQALLERVKTLEPESETLIAAREYHRSINHWLGVAPNRGPMGHAFLTRNPLLPKEYFAPVGVDEDVAKWNKDIEHSLLTCPGKYSIKVATFRGRTLLKAANDGVADDRDTRRAKETDPLVKAVEYAHNLTVALRSKGWEAYEFHDRNESYVCIGSFDEMQRTPAGTLAPATRDAQIIIDTFGASTPAVGFERPAYKEMGVKPENISKVEMKEQLIKQQFDQRFASVGDAVEGFHPKRFVGIPFDIQPAPIEAPKHSISSAYVRK